MSNKIRMRRDIPYLLLLIASAVVFVYTGVFMMWWVWWPNLVVVALSLWLMLSWNFRYHGLTPAMFEKHTELSEAEKDYWSHENGWTYRRHSE